MTLRRVRLASAALLLMALGAAAAWAWTPDLDRADLERRYRRPEDQMLSVGGTLLRVRDTGPRGGPVVIFIHGFAASLETWEGWATGLAADRHRVVRFDLPGSGLSLPDSSGDYTDRRSVQLVRALMDRLDVRHASLVGNSIGGRIAWRFAAETPDRVDRLVLVSPDGFASPGFAYGRAPKPDLALEAMRYALPRALLRPNLAASYADPGRLADATLTRYHDLLRAPGVRGALIRRLEQTVLVDPVPLLRRVRAPTLLVWGRHDRLIPFSTSDAYLRALPDPRLVPLDDAGHVPQEEVPDASIGPVRDFLDGR